MTDQDIRGEIADRVLISPGYAVAWALLQVADQQAKIATHLKYLGVGDAAGTMGAIEFLAVKTKEGLSEIASAVESVSL